MLEPYCCAEAMACVIFSYFPLSLIISCSFSLLYKSIKNPIQILAWNSNTPSSFFLNLILVFIKLSNALYSKHPIDIQLSLWLIRSATNLGSICWLVEFYICLIALVNVSALAWALCHTQWRRCFCLLWELKDLRELLFNYS